jgi:hypothetical protein
MDPNNRDQSPTPPSSLEETTTSANPEGKRLFTPKVKLVLTGILLFLIILIIGLKKLSNYSVPKTTPPADLSPTSSPKLMDDYTVEIKANLGKKLPNFDVFLKNKKTGKETFFINLPDIYVEHYHNAEFHNGNLYIIRRTGGDNGYRNNPNWTDMLWRYDASKQGKQLFAVQGLDFRVSADEKYIAVGNSEKVTILDDNGNPLKSFDSTQLKSSSDSPEAIELLQWSMHTLWLTAALGTERSELVKITVPDYITTKYDLAKVAIGADFAFNPEKALIAYSDYPVLLDSDTADTYAKSGKTVMLMLYNLDKKTTKTIATSVTKPFDPHWLNANTLQYNDTSAPENKRLEYKLP